MTSGRPGLHEGYGHHAREHQRMTLFIEQFIAHLWNRLRGLGRRTGFVAGLNVGVAMLDGQITYAPVTIPQGKRAEHVVILGKTGSGK